MTERTCFRCDGRIGRPIAKHANYITAEDTKTVETVKRIAAVKHTGETKALRDFIVNESGLNATQANMAIARRDEAYLRRPTEQVPEHVAERWQDKELPGIDGTPIGLDDFNVEHVPKPIKPENDADVVQNIEIEEEIEVEKTGLVCPDCTDKDDKIIWGIYD